MSLRVLLTPSMLNTIKYCLFWPWQLVRKLRIIKLFVLTIVAGALVTTFNSSLLIKSHDKVKDAHSIPLLTVPATHGSTPVHVVQQSFAPSSPQHTISEDSKSWKRLPQHKTTLITKRACERKYFLLILISSTPANFERRSLIRQTWGIDSNIIPRWKTYFLIGQTKNQTHSDLLVKENAKYNDLIRAEYYEHYWNQSLKIQMGFEWAARYCNFSYLLKGDDDILVNIIKLIDYLLLDSTPKESLYIGKLHSNPIVRRDGKWKVSYEEYGDSHYPDFCSGAGFIMTHDVIERIVPLFDVIKPYRLDDVYVGMLAKKAGVIAKDHSGFVMPWDDNDKCNFVENTLLQHQAAGKCLIKLFMMHLYNDGRANDLPRVINTNAGQ